MTIVAATLLITGTVLVVLASWGVVTLPNALARQHAATKAGTLAAAIICLGAMTAFIEPGWWIRVLAILAFMLATLPVSSHMLARAAVREADLEDSATTAPLIGGERSTNERV